MRQPLPLVILPLPLLLLTVTGCHAGQAASWDDLHQQFSEPPTAEAAAPAAEAPAAEVPVAEMPLPPEEQQMVASAPEPEPVPPPPAEPPVFARGPVVEEMRRLWIRDPEILLDTLESASMVPGAPPLSFLLAIAHAETNGRPLLISEAGAVGLAQATPSAFLLEEFEGPLFVTREYVEGMRAYILKKPLGDAVAIASTALGERRATPEQIPALLAEARRLSRVGVDELRLLERWYGDDLEAALESDYRRNEATLDLVERVVATGELRQIEALRDSIRRDYRALMDLQRRKWKQYEIEMTRRRDALLVERFGANGKELRGQVAYAAGEYLAQVFDARFSPAGAARFLAQHLHRKISEATRMGTEHDATSLAAALYNGGAHNVLRMQAGLIESLPETDRYSQKVPSTRRRIEAAMDVAPSAATGGAADVVGR